MSDLKYNKSYKYLTFCITAIAILE